MKVRQVDPATWIVDSDSGNIYVVFWNDRLGRFVCSCPHYGIKARTCKHIRAVESLLAGEPFTDSGGD